MRAIVLVGGFGTRLRPLTLTTPKQMLPVLHRPMIERVVGHLASHGVSEVVLSLGYRPDAFLSAYPDDICAGAKLFYAVEPEPLDTAGAIRFAACEAGLGDTFLVINGDVLTDLDITDLLSYHRDRGAEATIALTPVSDPSRYGVVPTDSEGRVEAFVEKPPPGEAPTNWINAGTYVCEPSVIDRIADGRPISIEREVFPAMVDAGVLYARQHDGYWLDAGTPATYLAAQMDMLDGRMGQADSAALHPTAEISPEADLAHSVVGEGAVVAAGARVSNSLLMAGVRVGEGAVVSDSVVGTAARIGSAASLSELTVVGDGESVAGGAVLVGERVPAPD